MGCSDGRLILASASERRRALLAEAGYDFEVRPAEVAEDLPEESADPAREAERLAEAKARAVALAATEPGRWVLGADTIVVLGRRLIGKPRDLREAEAILRALSGTQHTIITGVALVPTCLAPSFAPRSPDSNRDGGGGARALVRHAVTRVRMRRISEEEIRAYVAGGEALGKAGAYAVQGSGDRFIESIDGSFTNVVGLPMELVREMLAEIGWKGDGKR